MTRGVIKALIFDFEWTLYDPRKKCEVDGATRLLQDLIKEDYLLSILTKDKNNERKEIIDRLGFWKLAHVIYMREKKTEKDFLRCIRQMDSYLEPYEVAVVGDNILSEIYLGNLAGYRTIRFKFGEFSDEKPERELENAGYTIYKLSEIMDCLN